MPSRIEYIEDVIDRPLPLESARRTQETVKSDDDEKHSRISAAGICWGDLRTEYVKEKLLRSQLKSQSR